jgi:hypothetical protein
MTKIEMENSISEFQFEFNENDNCRTVTIGRYLGKSNKIVVPATFAGIPITNIGDFAFGNIAVTEIVLPEGIHSIGKDAFYNCTYLNGIDLPESLTSIGYGAFSDCEQIKKITLPKGITDIGDNVFSSCDNLSEIVVDKQNPFYTSNDGVLFDKNMTTIIKYPQGKKGDYTIPNGVIAVDSDAFFECRELTRIIFPHDFVCHNTPHCFFNNCEHLMEIMVVKNNMMFSSIDGVLFNKDENKLLQYPQGKKNTDYIVPEKTICIGGAAFAHCKWLTNITLPEKLKIIEYNAFSFCDSLSEIILPRDIQYIDNYAFSCCPNLKTIKLSKKTKLGYKPFKELLGHFSGQIVYLD